MYPYRWIVQCFHAQQHMKRARSISTLLHEIGGRCCMGTTNTFACTKQSGAYKFIATMYIYHELSRSVSVTFWSPSMTDHDVLLLHIFHRIFSIAFFEWMSRFLENRSFLGHFLAMSAPNHMKELKFLLKNILCGKLTKTYLSLDRNRPLLATDEFFICFNCIEI